MDVTKIDWFRVLTLVALGWLFYEVGAIRRELRRKK